MNIDEHLRKRIAAIKAQIEREGYRPESDTVETNIGPDATVDLRESRPVFVPVMASDLEKLCDVARHAREHWMYSVECSGGDITGCDLCTALAALDDPNIPEADDG